MKLMKKTLCIFMSVLMMFSALSVGLVGHAADDALAGSYRALAYAFFNYTRDTAYGSNDFIITKDEAGIPSLTILGDLSKYDTSTHADGYEYAADDGTPIRSVAYDHKVTAKDDSSYTIRNATNTFLGIVDKIISYEYGVGNYTVPMIIDAVSNELMYTKADDGEYLFLDGYTYYTDIQGNIVARSEEKTYTVEDDGDIVYDAVMTEDPDEEATELQQKIEAGVYTAKTLLEICDVETVIGYMCGNCTSVNSGNWFHNFEFTVYTDVETVLIHEGQNLKNAALTTYETTVTWTNDRQFDDSGLKAQYYNLGYTKTETSDSTTIRRDLKNLEKTLDNYFAKYLAGGLLENATNATLINSYYPEVSSGLAVFNSISDNAKIAVFGQKATAYMSLVTLLTPMLGTSSGIDNYAPTHTYSKYTDKNGNNIEFRVTTDKVASFVSAIDALLGNPAITKVLGMFLDLSQFGIDLEANNNATPKEAIETAVANLLYTDDMINLIISSIYPMIANLIGELLTDSMIKGLLEDVWDSLDNVVDIFADNGTSWLCVIMGVLAQELNVTLTPAGMAWVWNKYGYTTDPTYKEFCNMQDMHDMLQEAGGGRESDGAGHSTDGYDALPCMYEPHYLDHWSGVKWEEMVWNINGNKDRFLLALDAALAPLAPLLAVILGDAQTGKMNVLKVFGLPISLILNDGDNFHLYNNILVPVLETLGITMDDEKLLSATQFEDYAEKLEPGANTTATDISNFLNKGILDPILNWVFDEVLEDPIQTVMTLVPNLSHLLTSGAVFSILEGIKIPLKIDVGGALPIDIMTLDLKTFGLSTSDLAFLDSIQGVLTLIGLDVDTGEPIVGYYSDAPDSDYMVYPPTHKSYDPAIHNVAATSAFMNSYKNMNLYENGTFTTQIFAVDENGEYTEYAVKGVVGYYNSETQKIVDSIGARPELYTELFEYYAYSVSEEYYDPDLDQIVNKTTTYKVRTLAEVPAEYKEDCEKVLTYETRKEPISLPPIMDYKLQGCGTEIIINSARNLGDFSMTNKAGQTVKWKSGERPYLVMKTTDQNGTEHPTYGLVFLFLLRYALSAIGYSEYSGGQFTSKYTLLDAFGLDPELMNGELISGLGLTLGEIINHVRLNPDEIIAALFELLIGGEQGSLYRVVDGVVKKGLDYSYAPEAVQLYADAILEAAEEHGDYQYGTAVLYNEYWTEEDGQYFVDNLDDIAENVLAMLKLDDMDSLSGLIEGLLTDYVFNNDMVTMIVSLVYSLLGSLEFDLGSILDAVLGVDYSKTALLESIDYMFEGLHPEMYNQIQTQINKGDNAYTDYTFNKATVDRETGEIIPGESYDWGFNNPEITKKFSNSEIFLRALSAAFGPFSVLVEFIFMGEDINVLDIVHIPMYEIYHYAWIPLMEALGATEGLVSFEKYYTDVFANKDGDVAGGTRAFYWLLKPIVEFADTVVASPIETVLNLIPNLIFVLSIGGLNGIVNNIAHFAYVLLDMLEPIVDVYPVVNNLLSNLEVGGFALNLSLPLDVDLNQLVNELLDGLLGSLLSFDIENDNVVLDTQLVEKEVDVPVVDANGNQLYDKATGIPLTTKEMQMVEEDICAVGTLNITLPYLDLTTLCSGTITERTSAAGYPYVYLNSSGGADFFTLILRLVTDTLFYKDNWENICNFLIGFCDLDDEDDNDALLMEIFMLIHSKAQEVRMNDILMKFILTIYQVLVPLADNLGGRFKKVDFSVTDMFSDMDNLGYYADALMDASDEKNETLSGFAKIIQLIKDFFAMISEFFNKLFS